MRRIFSFLKPYKKQLVVGPSFKLLEAILELLIPTLMVSIVDIGVQNKDTSYILKMGGLMLGIAAVGLLSALICQYSASIASQGFGTDVRNALFKHIMSLSSKELDEIGTTGYTTRLTNDINTLQLAVAMLIRLVIRAPFISLGSIVMALYINARLSIIIILTLPILVTIVYFIMKKTIPLYKKVMATLDSLTLVVKENLQGVRVIRAFARRDREKKRFDNLNTDFANMSVKAGRISTLLNPATTLIMNIAIILILYFSGISIKLGNMTQGEIIAFINYISYMVTALLVTANLVILFTRAYTSAQRVSEVFEQSSSITDGGTKEIDKDAEYAVEFDDVFFAYNEGFYVLTDISFKLKRGESLGIIGGTGSGKTTLINLMMRMYDADKGSIRILGKDIKSYNINALRKSVAIVAQKSVIFSGTIEENIRQGNMDATMEDIHEAAKNAEALEFIMKKDDKFSHEIERGGTNLSGGQKQRLSIARALARKPEILILDDSLSALDYLTDSRVRENLSKYDMTKIIVSQRINSVKNCNNILVLEKGRVIGFGEHSTLMEECEVYQELCRTQLGGDMDD
ncbi:MAG TPA: ABC transporter ATP-binding protein [Clostridiaceae bacterium]|nr:ABC transporter ATP-binding protein [Clostridiaceae bacterium]